MESSTLSNLQNTGKSNKRYHNLKERNAHSHLLQMTQLYKQKILKLQEGKQDLLDLTCKCNNVVEHKINYITIW